MREQVRIRWWHIAIACVLALCVLGLVASHGGVQWLALASVLFFPVFLFGLLDLPQLLAGEVRTDDEILPPNQLSRALFQRPPPTFE
jgi:hypothetical protein